jgi:hypothetical protein
MPSPCSVLPHVRQVERLDKELQSSLQLIAKLEHAKLQQAERVLVLEEHIAVVELAKQVGLQLSELDTPPFLHLLAGLCL